MQMHRNSNIIVLDTETTGLPLNRFAAPAQVDNWPRVVQLSYIIYDRHAETVKEADSIICPNGFEIPSEASAIHGISTERALQEGQDLGKVLGKLVDDLRSVELIVGHNITFDTSALAAEFYRLEQPEVAEQIIRMSKYCTMEHGKSLCQIPKPGEGGKFGYKAPRLAELYRYLFCEDFEGAHNSLMDVRATARCYWRMVW